MHFIKPHCYLDGSGFVYLRTGIIAAGSFLVIWQPCINDVIKLKHLWKLSKCAILVSPTFQCLLSVPVVKIFLAVFKSVRYKQDKV